MSGEVHQIYFCHSGMFVHGQKSEPFTTLSARLFPRAVVRWEDHLSISCSPLPSHSFTSLTLTLHIDSFEYLRCRLFRIENEPFARPRGRMLDASAFDNIPVFQFLEIQRACRIFSSNKCLLVRLLRKIWGYLVG
jgi:hypothetical protein